MGGLPFDRLCTCDPATSLLSQPARASSLSGTKMMSRRPVLKHLLGEVKVATGVPQQPLRAERVQEVGVEAEEDNVELGIVEGAHVQHRIAGQYGTGVGEAEVGEVF